jgi:hypothetical protein
LRAAAERQIVGQTGPRRERIIQDGSYYRRRPDTAVMMSSPVPPSERGNRVGTCFAFCDSVLRALVLSLAVALALAACDHAASVIDRADDAAGLEANPSGWPGDATDATACTAPLAADGGVSNLDKLPDLPLAERCGGPLNGLGNLFRYDEPCAGSIVVSQGVGADCQMFWLFDAKTKALEATASACPGAFVCTSGVPGFVLPSQCVRGNVQTSTNLCTTDQPDGSADTRVTDASGN